MGANTAIEWADDTFNPWWGCTKVSRGCKNCYAENVAQRFGTEWGPKAKRRVFPQRHWNEPLVWNRVAARSWDRMRRVFCGSMCDVCDERAPRDEQVRLVNLIDDTPWLFWLLLSKRPHRYYDCYPELIDNPRRNVGFGTSVEDQAAADARVPELLKIKGASLLWLSCEPLVGPLDLTRVRFKDGSGGLNAFTGEVVGRARGVNGHPDFTFRTVPILPTVGWVVAGGESDDGGGEAEPCKPEWARGLRDQCVGAGVPFLWKQWGSHNVELTHVGKKVAGRTLDGREWLQFPEFPKPEAARVA